MEYYSVVRRNKVLVHARTLINLKCILQEVRPKGYILYDFIHVTSGKGKAIGTEKRTIITRDW